jgi:hypothetical protein
MWTRWKKLQTQEFAQSQSLREIGFNSATELFATYAGQLSDLRLAGRRPD